MALVPCVLMLDDGTLTQDRFNTGTDGASEILGCDKTFIGQYDEYPEDTFIVVLMKLHDHTHGQGKVHKLPPPLHNELCYGKILFLRMKYENDCTFPVSLRLDEVKSLFDNYI